MPILPAGVTATNAATAGSIARKPPPDRSPGRARVPDVEPVVSVAFEVPAAQPEPRRAVQDDAAGTASEHRNLPVEQRDLEIRPAGAVEAGVVEQRIRT